MVMAINPKALLRNGFTLVELIIVVAVIATISAIAIPAVSSYRDHCCVRATAVQTCSMLHEAKQRALVDEKYYAVGFDTVSGKISLISDRGADGQWNTSDDRVVRSFCLKDKGSVRFGYGSCGPLPDLAATADGVTFQTNNSAVCNPDLTGNAGTVYIRSESGAVAVAITMNSSDFTYKLWRWNGNQWERM